MAILSVYPTRNSAVGCNGCAACRALYWKEKKVHSGKQRYYHFWIAQVSPQVTSGQRLLSSESRGMKKKSKITNFFHFARESIERKEKSEKLFHFFNFFIALPGRLEERNEKRL